MPRGSKGSKDKIQTISDEEFLDQCIVENKICSHSTCSKSISVIRLQCELCKEYFCTSHLLPEIHGCGKAAKKAASAPVKKPPNPDQKKKLQQKMTQKLNELANDRKKKGK